jgi:fido (protein-threonine AMPylation protein)
MKIPLSPPTVAIGGIERLSRRLADPAPNGRYLHWDELRHRPPPPGLSVEDWWFAVKTARRLLYQPLPLADTSGRPFVFARVAPVLALLHRLDRDAAGQTPVPGPAIGEADPVGAPIDEAISSSQLEGATTARQIAAAMLREGRRPRDKSERMIFNNFQAMRTISARATQPLTPDTILELHRLLTRDTLDDPSAAGRLRRADERAEVVDHRYRRILHVPPHADALPERLERLCRFANAGDAEPCVPSLIRAILLHFALAYDHPFVDGNGRVARALFYWSALSQGYWMLECVSISSILKQAPTQYARAYLFTETDDSDVTYFLIHQLKTIVAAIDAFHASLATQGR